MLKEYIQDLPWMPVPSGVIKDSFKDSTCTIYLGVLLGMFSLVCLICLFYLFRRDFALFVFFCCCLVFFLCCCCLLVLVFAVVLFCCCLFYAARLFCVALVVLLLLLLFVAVWSTVLHLLLFGYSVVHYCATCTHTHIS